MAARFRAFDNQRIGALTGQALRKRKGRRKTYDFRPAVLGAFDSRCPVGRPRE